MDGCGLSFDVIESNSNAKDYLKRCANNRLKEGNDEAFYVCDIGTIIEKYEYFIERLPRVKPYYAVKCNNDIIPIMKTLGTNFDCASRDEIARVLDLGVSPDRIIYAHPCKQISHLEYAVKRGIQLTTFDSVEELEKIKKVAPNMRLILRITAGDFESVVSLSDKFGCTIKETSVLLKKAKELELDVVGVCFHVGSNCLALEAFPISIAASRQVIDEAKNLGFDMTILDIGGGLPGMEDMEINVEKLSEVINVALEKHFPESCGIDIIAEPGRYFAEESYTLAVNIVGKKIADTGSDEGNNGNKQMVYYVNDGVYGAFLCEVGLDRLDVCPIPLEEDDSAELYPTIVWGDTCDSMDKITQHEVLLPELNIRDWLTFDHRGAYTTVAYCGFNGMPTSLDRLFFIREDQLKINGTFLKVFQNEKVPFTIEDYCTKG